MEHTCQSLLERFDGSLPLELAKTIPAEWYFDQQLYERELATVFRRSWQPVARCEQLAVTGQFVALSVLDDPVVVVRDNDNQLRAYSNVCRHRGARVVAANEGKTTRFRCRYHGWTYDLNGRLRGAPEFDGVCDFDREAQCLPEYAVAPWGPFVWMQLARPEVDLARWLGRLSLPAVSYDIGSFQFHGRREYTVACNWKVYIDNYLDGGYHVNTVHPNLAGVLDYSKYRTDIYENASVQSSPIVDTESGADRSTSQVRKGEAMYAWIFPNFMMNLYSGVMDTNLVIPEGPNRCRVIFDFFFDRDNTAKGGEFIANSIGVADRVQDEDVEICEEVQRGLASGAFTTGRYSVKRESGVYHFHRLLAEYLRSEK